MSSGRNQKGMNSRNHHDNLSFSGHRQSYVPKPGKSNNSSSFDFFKPAQKQKPLGSPFNTSGSSTRNNKKPWWSL